MRKTRKNSTGKTLYLWDLANTLFPEAWNAVRSGFPTLQDYFRFLGYNPETISPHDYEWAHERPYCEGMFDLSISDGFQEVLSQTKHNETFSTGNREQMDWRAEYLNPRVGFDIRGLFEEMNSTFDYGPTNTKTRDMLVGYLLKKYDHGYQTVAYTDDKLPNGEEFVAAARVVQSRHPDFGYRLYHFLNDGHGLRIKEGYWEIGSLYDLLLNERTMHAL